MHYDELSNIGMNSVTAGFVGTLAFTVLQGLGLVSQIRKIESMDSVKSIPIWLYFYFTAHFFSFAVYGMRTNHLSPIIAGIVLGSLNLGVFIASKKEELKHDPTILTILSFPIFAMIGIEDPYHHKLMGIFYIAGTVLLLQSPYQILKNKSSGAVDLLLQITIFATVAFWALYGYAVKDMALFWNCLVSLVILSVTIALWFKYREVVLDDDEFVVED